MSAFDPKQTLALDRHPGAPGINFALTTAKAIDMTTERMDRRLMAILAADVAGYSRLVGADEEGTLAQWKAHFRELIEPKIAEHHGRIVRSLATDCWWSSLA